jgi:hypothetical protein
MLDIKNRLPCPKRRADDVIQGTASLSSRIIEGGTQEIVSISSRIVEVGTQERASLPFRIVEGGTKEST